MNRDMVLYQDEQLVVSSERVLPGAPYPNNFLHGVLANPKDAVSAVCGLRAAGYDANDIYVWTGWAFVEAVERQRRQHSLFAKAVIWLTSLLDESFGDIYLHEARKGRHILTVHVPHREQLEKVCDLLLFHRANLLKYVDTWTVADLHPSLAQAWAASVLSATPRAPYR